jgi:hypothetical protein
MDSGSTPQGIGLGHSCNEGTNLGIDARAASRGAREDGPVLAEATSLPPQDGVGGHDHQGLSPPGPDSGEEDPPEAIGRVQSGPRRGSLVDGELLAPGEVLQGELTVAAAEEGQKTEQLEQEGDHRAAIVSGSD